MVRVVTAATPAQAVRLAWPEAVVTVLDDADDPADAGRVQAWVAGPGMGTTDAAGERLTAILRASVPVLVDADALTLLSLLVRLKHIAEERTEPTLITPHAGELARLLGTDSASVEKARLEHARRAAAELGVTVLLKGSTTVIATPHEETVLVNPTGTGWLATAGSGDVLSGLAGAFLAQGLKAADAGIAAAYLHGLAARLAAGRETTSEAPIGASDVIRALPDAIRAVAG
jgi:hydroxyethylthiazole kinase-like uncharacterized protein yjeF